MADEAPNPEKPELRIGGYRVIQQLGSGGMSSVFRAVHDESGHEVAVKVLPRTLARNPTLLQRFLREAKSAEALEHQNIVAIFDRGVDQGRHYLVLEYVPGGDLHDRVRDEGPLAIPEAVRVVREVAAGLSYASSLGLIHRDVKPANILVSPTGQVKIIDLGLALQAEAEDERVTRDGTTVGTVDYMSPEQARDSRATSEKSDMYSLGCTLFFLLTGSAPFAGGDVADKLARHCTQPAPDPRALRPDIPPALAALTRKLMAKRPENRFESYASLIAALDAVAKPGHAEVLDALIDDDDDDELAPDPSAPALNALIADDSDPEVPVRKPAARPRSREVPNRPEPAPVDMLSMADLAALEDDAPAAKPVRPPRPPAPQPVEPSLSLLEEAKEEDVPVLPGRSAHASSHFGDAASQALVKRSIAIGLTVILLVIGVHQLWKATHEKPETDVPAPEAPTEWAPRPVVSGTPVAPSPPRPNVTTVQKKAATKKSNEPAKPTEWVEPADPAPETVAESEFAPGVEDRYIPDWARQPIPDRLGTMVVPVRRLRAPENGTERPNLRLGLDLIAGAATIELADDGPFCEDDLRIPGEARLVRARPGFRPIVKVEPPKLPVVREQTAVIVLEGKQLVLDGLDLVVDVDELPRHQTALFECAAGALTLRDCTITVLNPRGTAFSVVRTSAAARPSRVRLERCYIRGPSQSAFELAGGPCDVVVSRSVLFTGAAPLVREPGRDRGSERKLSFVRSVLGCRAPVIDLDVPPGGQRPKSLSVRALACTFAAIKGASPSSVVLARGVAGGASERLQWLGDQNVLAGWSAFYSAPGDVGGAVPNLAAARRVWTGTDATTQEHAAPWPEPPAYDRVVPAQLRALAPERSATITRVPAPSALLHEKTFLAFDRPRVPELAREFVTTAATPVSPAPSVSMPGRSPVNSGTVAEQPLVFDPAATPWNGDLGLYLRDRLEHASGRLRVYVKGQGTYPFTPVRMPPGVSLEILGEPDAEPDAMPTWSPAPAAASSADALIAVRDADLVVAGVHFVCAASARPVRLFHVERGHLAVYRCRLIAPGAAEPGGGGLIAFRATTTEPLPVRTGPFAAAPDRPTCRVIDSTLITGGHAIVAELGRGQVALTDCAVAAGGSAFVLMPSPVARARFDADLWLDRCTVAAARNFVRLEPWKGTDPGPDRPWLVTTRSSAFIASFATVPRDQVLLRSVGEALAHGALFWQGNNDAFEVPHFTAVDEQPPASNPRPDLRRQWLDLWGASHFRNPIGPGIGKPGAPASVRFAERLKPGDIEPRDLVLESRERRPLEVGADAKVLKLAVPTGRGDRKN